MKSKKLFTVKKEPLHAHGGGIFFDSGFYYFYGEDRTDNNYVSIYRSKDLKNWEFRNHILTTNSKEEALLDYSLGLVSSNKHKVNIERPKIFYSEELKKYVMWAHYENGIDYSVAACCLATCDTIDGDYTFHGYFRPLDNMSRDLTIFEDDNARYLISASNDNKDLHIYKLSCNGLEIDSLVNKLFISRLREAPAIFKSNGTYFLLTSYCTGWFPNQCKYATSTSIDGNFSKLKNIGNKTTSHSQPMNILKLGNAFIYLGDRWGGNKWTNLNEFDYFKSEYTYSYLVYKDDKLMFSSKEVSFDGTKFIK